MEIIITQSVLFCPSLWWIHRQIWESFHVYLIFSVIASLHSRAKRKNVFNVLNVLDDKFNGRALDGHNGATYQSLAKKTQGCSQESVYREVKYV